MTSGGRRSSSISPRPRAAARSPRASAAPLESDHLPHPHVAADRLAVQETDEPAILDDRQERQIVGAESLERRAERIVWRYGRELGGRGHHLFDRCRGPAILLDLAEVADRDEADEPVAGNDRDRPKVHR